MSLPAPTKTWQITRGRFNTAGLNNTTVHATLLLAIKNAMIGFASSPWTVFGSFNTASGNVSDGVDRWVTAANIGWNLFNSGGLISSIHLIQPGMSNSQIQFHGGYSAGGGVFGLGIRWSYSSQFGSSAAGSTSSPPQATDQQDILANATGNQGWFMGSTSSFVGNVNWVVMQTTDGSSTRIFAWGAPIALNSSYYRATSYCYTAAFFETLIDVETGVTVPYMYCWQGGLVPVKGSTTGSQGNVTLDKFSNAPASPSSNTCGILRPTGGTAKSCLWSIPGNLNNTLGTAGNLNVYDGGLDAWPIDVVQTSPRCYVGRIVDCYATNAPENKFLPASSAPVWDMPFPGVVVPCGGVPFRRD